MQIKKFIKSGIKNINSLDIKYTSKSTSSIVFIESRQDTSQVQSLTQVDSMSIF
jgi:hypothetical protein